MRLPRQQEHYTDDPQWGVIQSTQQPNQKPKRKLILCILRCVVRSDVELLWQVFSPIATSCKFWRMAFHCISDPWMQSLNIVRA
eukprot:10917394-Lingulodinium_polyedra.AAC.1